MSEYHPCQEYDLPYDLDKIVLNQINVTIDQSLLVVDAMTGQDAVNVAEQFDQKVGIDGVILFH